MTAQSTYKLDSSSNNTAQVEHGSFRDREARVFYLNDIVYRGISEKTLRDFRKLSSTKFYQNAINSGSIIATQEIPAVKIPSGLDSRNWAGILAHEKISFISYPYEWCFGMLKDAALLHLKLLSDALEEDFILKDSSSFNIQWDGSKPVFIDIPSFQPLSSGEPWGGYKQFCQMFLFPLLLQAYKGVPFQTLLRGNIDGIEAKDFYNLMSFRDMFRAGVLKHGYLQTKLQNRYSSTKLDVRSELKDLGFHKELIRANLKSITSLITKLSLPDENTVWADYADNNSYNEITAKEKQDFVRTAVFERKRNIVWDLGCNTGTFSKIALENSSYVVAMDFDYGAIERLYQDLKSSNNSKILPLVMNLANPSPDHGWRGLERKSISNRSNPELILALALIHHAVISANIPLSEFVNWLSSFNADLVIEFVTKDDPMVKTLLANKEDNYDDYSLENFEAQLKLHFTIATKKHLASGTRYLYYCRK